MAAAAEGPEGKLRGRHGGRQTDQEKARQRTLLKLYSYYKQATEATSRGSARVDSISLARPSIDAWAKLKG